jgi:hypothetical protein
MRRLLRGAVPKGLLLGLLFWSSCTPEADYVPDAAAPDAELSRVKQRYLDLMKWSLTDLIYENDPRMRARLAADASFWRGLQAGEQYGYPERAHTMIGLARLENIQTLVEDIIARGIPGDLIEAGAWRGGATIFMRAVLEANGVTDRTVWVADSFEGMPPPNPEEYPADEGLDLSGIDDLAVSHEEVASNFERYGLLDEQVRFLKGWFKDTLPTAPIEQLAVFRVDADLYESTMDAMVPLYPKVASGGYVIVDDYKLIPACRQAVDDYRAEHGITAPSSTSTGTRSTGKSRSHIAGGGSRPQRALFLAALLSQDPIT